MKTKSMSKIICLALATIVDVPVLLFARTGADDKSAATYKAKCASCHGADGKGDTPAGKSTKTRSFADPEVVKASDDDFAGIIEKGKGKMPGYSKSMKPDAIKDMVAYIRSLAKRSEEHTSELQSRLHLVCRLLLEKKKKEASR